MPEAAGHTDEIGPPYMTNFCYQVSYYSCFITLSRETDYKRLRNLLQMPGLAKFQEIYERSVQNIDMNDLVYLLKMLSWDELGVVIFERAMLLTAVQLKANGVTTLRTISERADRQEEDMDSEKRHNISANHNLHTEPWIKSWAENWYRWEKNNQHPDGLFSINLYSTERQVSEELVVCYECDGHAKDTGKEMRKLVMKMWQAVDAARWTTEGTRKRPNLSCYTIRSNLVCAVQDQTEPSELKRGLKWLYKFMRSHIYCYLTMVDHWLRSLDTHAFTDELNCLPQAKDIVYDHHFFIGVFTLPEEQNLKMVKTDVWGKEFITGTEERYSKKWQASWVPKGVGPTSSAGLLSGAQFATYMMRKQENSHIDDINNKPLPLICADKPPPAAAAPAIAAAPAAPGAAPPPPPPPPPGAAAPPAVPLAVRGAPALKPDKAITFKADVKLLWKAKMIRRTWDKNDLQSISLARVNTDKVATWLENRQQSWRTKHSDYIHGIWYLTDIREVLKHLSTGNTENLKLLIDHLSYNNGDKESLDNDWHIQVQRINRTSAAKGTDKVAWYQTLVNKIITNILTEMETAVLSCMNVDQGWGAISLLNWKYNKYHHLKTESLKSSGEKGILMVIKKALRDQPNLLRQRSGQESTDKWEEYSRKNGTLRSMCYSSLQQDLPALDPTVDKYLDTFNVPNAKLFFRLIKCNSILALRELARQIDKQKMDSQVNIYLKKLDVCVQSEVNYIFERVRENLDVFIDPSSYAILQNLEDDDAQRSKFSATDILFDAVDIFFNETMGENKFNLFGKALAAMEEVEIGQDFIDIYKLIFEEESL